MRHSRIAARFAAAALSLWSAFVSAAPGVTGGAGFGGTVSRGSPAANERRTLEADLRVQAFRLWEAGGFGLDRSEHAAWAVAAPAGISWRPWPWDRRDLTTRWLGPAPPGAVAIVHTHPAVVDPRPSSQDRTTAARLGIAVYTVSRSGIWRAEPGGVLTLVGDETWWAGCEAGKSCREGSAVPATLAQAGNRASSETAVRPSRITE